MKLVIIGGNERMVCKYADVCKCHGCEAKILVKENGTLKKKIGAPDLMILLTNTVSHKMVNSAVMEAKKCGIRIRRCRRFVSRKLDSAHGVGNEAPGRPRISGARSVG